MKRKAEAQLDRDKFFQGAYSDHEDSTGSPADGTSSTELEPPRTKPRLRLSSKLGGCSRLIVESTASKKGDKIQVVSSSEKSDGEVEATETSSPAAEPQTQNDEVPSEIKEATSSVQESEESSDNLGSTASPDSKGDDSKATSSVFAQNPFAGVAKEVQESGNSIECFLESRQPVQEDNDASSPHPPGWSWVGAGIELPSDDKSNIKCHVRGVVLLKFDKSGETPKYRNLGSGSLSLVYAKAEGQQEAAENDERSLLVVVRQGGTSRIIFCSSVVDLRSVEFVEQSKAIRCLAYNSATIDNQPSAQDADVADAADETNSQSVVVQTLNVYCFKFFLDEDARKIYDELTLTTSGTSSS